MPITRAYGQASQPGNAFLAGKNKIINGDFYINQRGFSSTTTDNAFGFDRWFLAASGGTTTYSSQTFTPGAAPVAGYEGKTYARIVTTGQTTTDSVSMLRTRIEDVRTLANQTATLSFWAKANTGTPKIATEIQQRFGTGGSPSAEVQTYGGQVTLSTSWARYSVTISIPSISGKTIGTSNDSHVGVNLFVSAGSDYNGRTGSLGIQTNTFDIWGVQLEAGSVATAFQTATGTLAGELAACKRYFERHSASSTSGYGPYAAGYANFATAGNFAFKYETEKRAQPTITFGSSVGQFIAGYRGNGGVAAVTLTAGNITRFGSQVTLVPSGTPFTQGDGMLLLDAGSAASYIDISAEL